MLFLFHPAVLTIVFRVTTLDSNALPEGAALVEWGLKINVSMPVFCLHMAVMCLEMIPLCGALVLVDNFVSSPLSGFFIVADML